MQLELENTNTKCEDDRLQQTEEALYQQLHHIKQQLIMNCKTASELNHLKGKVLLVNRKMKFRPALIEIFFFL